MIPNNVHLELDQRTSRALASWGERFRQWWSNEGPSSAHAGRLLYLRVATNGSSRGGARYDYIDPAEYPWGIFAVPCSSERAIAFGDSRGRPVWHEPPLELRPALLRLVAAQADTEPAAVEQQRHLGNTAPSQYDLRNYLQINVEEARHAWSMAYVLFKHFGRPGGEVADALFSRRSGDRERPRMLDAFNDPIEDWLSFFMFATFVDRDGKYQLTALAESGFEPLAACARFMRWEEAHHTFVGQDGVARLLRRTCEAMKANPNEDAAAAGAIPLDVVQRYLNFWYSRALDLFGSEISEHAALLFDQGIKGCVSARGPNRLVTSGQAMRRVEVADQEGNFALRDVPTRLAVNEILRDAYIAECLRLIDHWNRCIERSGIGYRLHLPERRFNRRRGQYAKHCFDTTGRLLSPTEWQASANRWLPTAEDRALVATLMRPPSDPSGVASWIAPPERGIGRKLPLDQYVLA